MAKRKFGDKAVKLENTPNPQVVDLLREALNFDLAFFNANARVLADREKANEAARQYARFAGYENPDEELINSLRKEYFSSPEAASKIELRKQLLDNKDKGILPEGVTKKNNLFYSNTLTTTELNKVLAENGYRNTYGIGKDFNTLAYNLIRRKFGDSKNTEFGQVRKYINNKTDWTLQELSDIAKGVWNPLLSATTELKLLLTNLSKSVLNKFGITDKDTLLLLAKLYFDGVNSNRFKHKSFEDWVQDFGKNLVGLNGKYLGDDYYLSYFNLRINAPKVAEANENKARLEIRSKSLQEDREFANKLLLKGHELGVVPKEITDPSLLTMGQFKLIVSKTLFSNAEKSNPVYKRWMNAITKDNTDLLEALMAGIVTAPVAAYGALTYTPIIAGSKAGQFIGGTAKYMVMHPIESFVMPEMIRLGANKGFDYLEDNGVNVNKHVRNASTLALSILGPNIFANGVRSAIGTKLYDSSLGLVRRFSGKTAERLSNSNNFRNLFLADIGYTRSGVPVTSKLTRAVNAGRYIIPLLPGTVLAIGESYLPGGSISGTLLEKLNFNPYIAEAIDLGVNAFANHIAVKNTNILMDLPVAAFKLLSDGSLTLYLGFANVLQHASDFKMKGLNHFVDNNGSSYLLIYNLTPRLFATQYRSKTYAHTTKNSDVDKLETLLSHNNKTLKIGDTFVDGTLEVVDILPTGSKFNRNNISSELGRQLSNLSGRYANGNTLYVLRTKDSAELPSLKEIQKSGDFEALSFDGSGTIPITEHSNIPKIGVYGDFKLSTDINGNVKLANPGGHLLSLIRDKKSGKIFAIETDLSGTGSTTRGSDLSSISDSAQNPYILSRVTELNPNIPIQDLLGLMTVANRTELPNTISILKEGIKPLDFIKFNGKKNKTWSVLDKLKANSQNLKNLNKEYQDEVVDWKLTRKGTIKGVTRKLQNGNSLKSDYIEKMKLLNSLMSN